MVSHVVFELGAVRGEQLLVFASYGLLGVGILLVVGVRVRECLWRAVDDVGVEGSALAGVLERFTIKDVVVVCLTDEAVVGVRFALILCLAQVDG